MARLETQIRRTTARLEEETYRSVEEFYSLIHHLDRLQARYFKHHGFNYNPHRDDTTMYEDGIRGVPI